MATNDDRNFRSYYYEKFGFRGVEEKKSIEILLKDTHLEREKLAQFCLRFPVPSIHRALVWKMLLGVVPTYSNTHEFVLKQRQAQYDDLIHCIRITRRMNNNTPKSEIFLKMFLVEESRIKDEEDEQFEDPENQDFLAIALAMEKMFHTDLEVYWLTKNFVKAIRKFRDTFNSMKELFCQVLNQTNSKLYSHLQKLEAINFLPLSQWFNRCYAGTLHESSLEKIWDKVIGGSSKVLVFVGVAILVTYERPLLNCQTPQEINRYISGLTEESSEVIVNQAMDAWSKYGEIGRIKSN